MKKTALLLALSMMIFTTRPATAFDNERKGFLLGFGLGVGGQTMRFSDEARENFSGGGVFGSPRIGWGLSDNTELYAFNAGITSLQFYFIPIPYTASVTGLGIRQYLNWPMKGLYVGAGGGMGSINWVKGVGLGGMADLGWEFSKHWTLGFQAMTSAVKPVRPYEGQGTDVKGAGSVSLVFSGTAY